MRIRLRSVCLVALLAARVLRGQNSAADEPALWSSYGTCAHPTAMIIELRADEHLLHRKTVKFCHSRHAQRWQRHFATILTFAVAGGRTYQDEYRTTRAEAIRADIWQASADTDAVVLGVSFASKRQILLNTLHILMPGKSRTDTIDRGLTVTSYPASARKPSNDR